MLRGTATNVEAMEMEVAVAATTEATSDERGSVSDEMSGEGEGWRVQRRRAAGEA